MSQSVSNPGRTIRVVPDQNDNGCTTAIFIGLIGIGTTEKEPECIIECLVVVPSSHDDRVVSRIGIGCV